MPSNAFGNPFAIPQIKVTSLRTDIPDASKSLAGLMKMQAAQQRMALAGARTAASAVPAEGNPKFGQYVMVPQKDGTKKSVWVWGSTAKTKDAAAAEAIKTARQNIIDSDEALQKDLANFESLSVPGRKEVLDRVRQQHAPRLAKTLGISGEDLSKQLTTGLDQSIRKREQDIKEAGVGTQLLDAGKMIFRRGIDAISSIFDSSAEKLARGHAAAEAEAQAIRDNAFRDELAKLEAEGRSTTGFQASNPLRSAINMGAPLAAMIAPAVVGGALAGPAGAIAGGAAGGAAMSAAETLERVATDPNLSEAEKEEKIGATEALSAGISGALGAIPFGPSALLRPATRVAASRAVPAAVPYRMLPGATAEETARVGQRWVAEQAAKSSPSIFREIPRHAVDAAILGGAFQIGSNLAYGMGTGQDVPLTEGLGEAIASGAILGVPFGLAARMRQRAFTPEQRQRMLDNTSYLRPLNEVTAREPMLALPPALAEQPVTSPAGRVDLALPPGRRVITTEGRVVPDGTGPIPQPAGMVSPELPPAPGRLERSALERGTGAWPMGTEAKPEPSRPVQEETPSVIAMPQETRTQSIQSARDFLQTKPTSKKVAAYIQDALENNSLSVEDVQALRQEYYNDKKKPSAQSVIVKGIDKGIANVNRTATETGSTGQPAASVEPAGQGRTGGTDAANPPVDSTVSGDTAPVVAATPDNVVEQVAGSSTAPQGRGDAGTPAPDTRPLETTPAAADIAGAGRTENPVGERSVEPAATPDAAGSEGQRGNQPTPEQRPADAGNAEPANAGPVTPRISENASVAEIAQSVKKGRTLTSLVQQRLQSGKLTPQEVRAFAEEATSKWQKKSAEDALAMYETTQKLPDTLANASKADMKAAQKLVRDEIHAALLENGAPEYWVKDTVKSSNWEELRNVLLTADVQLSGKARTFLDELAAPAIEKRRALREKELQKAREELGLPVEEPVQETAPVKETPSVPADNGKPLTEKTYAITKKNLTPVLVDKLKRANITENNARDYIEYDDWYRISEILNRTRQLDPALESKLQRLQNYNERESSLGKASDDVAKIEQAVQDVIKNPTPENLDAAKKIIDSADATLRNVRNARTVIEEHAKPETEPVAQEYTKLKDDRVFEEEALTKEPEVAIEETVKRGQEHGYDTTPDEAVKTSPAESAVKIRRNGWSCT